MNSSINRFIKSLGLCSKFNITINKVHKLSNNKWTEPHLELYHAPRTDDLDSTIKNIQYNGFKYDNHSFNNKGNGVYFSSHARYPYLWLGDMIPIYICSVLYKNGYIKRYRAEISHGYEYCVTDAELVIPQYLVEYKVDGDWKNIPEIVKYKSVYIPHGKFGCPKCDPNKIRCDCELVPTIPIEQRL